jgi:hypothetical protein
MESALESLIEELKAGTGKPTKASGPVETNLDAFLKSLEDGTWTSRQANPNPTPERTQTNTEDSKRPVLRQGVSLERAKEILRLVDPPCPHCSGMGQCLCDSCAKTRRDGSELWIDRGVCKRCKGTGAFLQ